jgi:hypothetical protein
MSELKKKSARRIPKPIEMRKKDDADKLKLSKDDDDKKWDMRMHMRKDKDKDDKKWDMRMRKDKDNKNTYKKWDLHKDKKDDLGKLDKKIYYLSNTSYVDDGKKRMEKHLEVKSNGSKKNAYYIEKENGNVKVELDNVKKIELYLKKH